MVHGAVVTIGASSSSDGPERSLIDCGSDEHVCPESCAAGNDTYPGPRGTMRDVQGRPIASQGVPVQLGLVTDRGHKVATPTF